MQAFFVKRNTHSTADVEIARSVDCVELVCIEPVRAQEEWEEKYDHPIGAEGEDEAFEF